LLTATTLNVSLHGEFCAWPFSRVTPVTAMVHRDVRAGAARDRSDCSVRGTLLPGWNLRGACCVYGW